MPEPIDKEFAEAIEWTLEWWGAASVIRGQLFMDREAGGHRLERWREPLLAAYDRYQEGTNEWR